MDVCLRRGPAQKLDFLPLHAAVAALVLAGCGVETVIHDIDEKEANDIVVLLDDYDIQSVKQIRDTGRAVFYSIAVSGSKRVDALKILSDNEYPRRKIDGYGEVFAESGLIPTSAEEKAKKMRAIEGEIERALTMLTGVVDAEVNLVIPEENALRTGEEAQTPTTASVAVKYLPGAGGAKPITEPQIRSIVAYAVEKLTTDQVVVAMTEASRPGKRAVAECAEPSGTAGGRGLLGRLSERAQKLLVAGAVVVVLILSLLLFFGQIRLRNVRGRLIRLQNEIAKARRKDVPVVTE